MKQGESNLSKILASANFVLSENTYVYSTVCSTLDDDFFEVISKLKKHNIVPEMTFVEGDYITLIVDIKLIGFVRELFPLIEVQYSCRKITCDVHTSLEGVGLTRFIADTLASHNIACNIVAAYFYDHIFVEENKALLAQKLLHKKL